MIECSVVIITRQRLWFLRHALASALDQRDVDHEVIVVVDESTTDGTQEYLATVTDPRLRTFTCPQRGISAPRNVGLGQASAEWVALLDDDDLWAPTKLRQQLDAASATGRSWAYTGCVQIDDASKVIAGRPPLPPDVTKRLLAQGGTPPASSLIWKPEVLGAERRFDPRLRTAEDWDLTLRLGRTGPPAMVAEPLLAYREHQSNGSLAVSTYKRDVALIQSRNHLGPSVKVTPSFLPAGSWAYHAGRRGEALVCYLRALRNREPGAMSRLLGVGLPQALHERFRRQVVSDKAWMREAESWLREYQETEPAATTPSNH